MRLSLTVVFCLGAALLLGLAPAADASSPGSWRIVGVYSNRFDYKFMSVSGADGPNPKLAFNRIDGRTFFVAKGEKLGDYTLESFETSVERVFNMSVRAYQRERIGSAVLRGKDGEKVTLEMGKPAPSRPGKIAKMVKIPTGKTRLVRVGDVVYCDPVPARITSISASTVGMVAQDQDWLIPRLSDGERADLIARRVNSRAATAAAQVVQNNGVQRVDIGVRDPNHVNIPFQRPARFASVTFNPLQHTTVTPAKHIAASMVYRERGADGKTRIKVLRIPLDMPMFHTTTYRGSILVPVR